VPRSGGGSSDKSDKSDRKTVAKVEEVRKEALRVLSMSLLGATATKQSRSEIASLRSQ